MASNTNIHIIAIKLSIINW